VLIRDPRPEDASALGRLHAAAWNVAYEGLMPAELLAQVTVQRRTAMWQRVLGDVRGERQHIMVGDMDGVAVGFAWIGPCRDTGETALDNCGELFAINVAPEHWGSGVGTALVDAAHEALAAQGFPVAVLWVVTGNARARRFYEHTGWSADGVTRELEDGGFLIPETRYVRHLGSLRG
jgi:GNAT superfamily N-acetyltransferase